MIEYPAEIIFDKEDEVFNVEFVDLPGCLTYGETMDEAQANAKEALNGYLSSIDLRKIDIPIPSKLKKKNIYYIKPELNTAFAIWLKLSRTKNGYSQKDMAEILNITFQGYQKYENPIKANPTLKTISKLENILHENIIAL